MKRFGIAILAALMVVSLTIPAWAIESQFGGYFRTRFYTQQNFTGEDDTEAEDISAVDTRTRLYYTAIFHENLKFVTKFEFDAYWGDDGYGDIGADGIKVEVKNAYADFNTGAVNWKVGTQGTVIARGFIFDDDFSGVNVAYLGDTFKIPFIWMKAHEGGQGKDRNDMDVDYYVLAPSFKIGDMFNLNPYFMYAYSSQLASNNIIGYELNKKTGLVDPVYAGWDPTIPGLAAGKTADELNLWYVGLDVDVDFGMGSAWGTFIYQGGEVDHQNASTSQDFKAWLAAVGGEANFGMFGVHGQFFYATGDDGEDDDIEQFFVPKGQSYYWSEIMGYGILGDTSFGNVSNRAPADQIGNVWAANLGATVKPMDKLKITLDLWYAALAEDVVIADGSSEDSLGTEVDLVITYELVQNLNLDIVGAYLFAGDATTNGVENDANPYEVGARLSLSF